VKALGVILHFWLIDDLYSEPYGRAYLNNLTGTPQYVSWLTRKLRPHLGDTVLEIGAGIGTLTGRLMGRRLCYVAADVDPLYLHALRNRFLRTPNVEVRRLDPACAEDYENAGGPFDTVLCVNVLEYADDAARVLALAGSALKPGGSLIVLVPQGHALFGTIDKTLGHQRRFQAKELRGLLEQQGYRVRSTSELNKVGSAAWWISSRILRRQYISKLTLKIFDKTVWITRRLDGLLPWRGLSLIAVAEKAGS